MDLPVSKSYNLVTFFILSFLFHYLYICFYSWMFGCKSPFQLCKFYFNTKRKRHHPALFCWGLSYFKPEYPAELNLRLSLS